MKKNVTVISEIQTLSSDNVKHYLLSDGTHRLVVRSEPVTFGIPDITQKVEPNSERLKGSVDPKNLIEDFADQLEKSNLSDQERYEQLSIAQGSLQKSSIVANAISATEESTFYNMYGIDSSGNVTQSNDSYIASSYRGFRQNYIGFGMSLASAAAKGIIKNVSLTLTTSGYGSCGIYKLNNNTPGESIATVPDGVTVSVNMNKAIPIAQFGIEYFCIVADGYTQRYFVSNTNSNTAQRPFLTIDYIPVEEILVGQKFLECKAGDSAVCNVDILTGVPYVGMPLLNLGGEKFPLSLSLHYDAIKPTTYMLGLNTGLSKGVYTNYHQTCYREIVGGITRYIYTDAKRINHVFVPAINSSALWVDSQGTGLLLEVSSNNIRIFNEDENSFLFDSFGRLISIAVKQTDTVFFTNTINYVNDTTAKIDSIVDGMGRILRFTYSTTGTSIKLDDVEKIIIAKNSSNILTSVTKIAENGKLKDNIFYNAVTNFTISSSGKISSIQSAAGDTISLTYYNSYRVRTIYDPNSKVTQSFDYSYFSTMITSNKGIKWAYTFNETGEFISSYERKNSEDKSVYFVNKEACERYGGTLSTDKDIIFKFSSSSTLSFYNYSTYTAQSNLYRTTTANINNYAVFSMALTVTGGYMNSGDNSTPILAELIDGVGNTLSSLEFTPYVTGVQVAAKTFKLKGSNTSSYGDLKVKFTINAKGQFSFSDMWITPINGGVQAICSNINTGNGGNYLFNSEILYYLNENQKIVDGSSTYYNTLHSADYVANERNFYTKTGSTWNMWVDNKKQLIVGVNSPTVYFDNNYAIAYNASYALYFTTLSLKNEIADADRQTHRSSDQLILAFGVSYMRQTLNSYTKTSATSASMNYSQNIYYDKYGRSLKSVDSKVIVNYTYDNNGYLLSTMAQDVNNTANNILESRGYSDDFLTEQKDYLLSTIGLTNVQHNSNIGNVSKVSSPNGFDTNYLYYPYGDKVSRVNGTVDSILNYGDTEYENGKLKSYYHNGFSYVFGYDSGNDVNSIKINDVIYCSITHTYTDNENSVSTAFDNGSTVSSKYDKYGRQIEVSDSDYDYAYFIYADDQTAGHNASSLTDSSLAVSSQSRLYKIVDNFSNDTQYLTYDDYGNTSKIELRNMLYDSVISDFAYDSRQRLIEANYTINNIQYMKLSFVYRTGANAKQDEVQILTAEMSDVTLENRLNKDNLERISTENLNIVGGTDGYVKEYDYFARNATADAESGTTEYVSKIKHKKKINGALSTYREDEYTYDINRNILTARSYSSDISYEYDAANRLLRENNPHIGKTYKYEYDAGGNITGKKEYAYTTGDLPYSPITTYNYAYSALFKDRLDTWNNTTIDYDSCGNPVLFKNMTMSWTRGRLLDHINVSADNLQINFTYDGSGIRRSKSVYKNSGLAGYYEYGIENNRIIYERFATTLRYPTYQTTYFIYGQNGIVGANIRGKTYYYVKNLMGDVAELWDATTNQRVASYKYDAWGNHKVYDEFGNENTNDLFVGNLNPIRYRGYYWDRDLNMYYLQTRYYDPEIGRFINLDQIEYIDPEVINGINLYAYCLNNPVMGTDPEGTFVFALLMLSVVLVGVGVSTGIVGGEVRTGDSIQTSSNYYGLVTTESGVGYGKSTESQTPITFYLKTPKDWWKFWEYSVGLDVNFDGYGVDLSLSMSKVDATLNLKSQSYGMSLNALGRLSFEKQISDSKGNYIYNSLKFNLPEIALIALAAVYAPQMVAVAAKILSFIFVF